MDIVLAVKLPPPNEVEERINFFPPTIGVTAIGATAMFRYLNATILKTILLVSIFFGASAHAVQTQAYSPELLKSVQEQGKPVALHFHADWCSTCKAQEKVLEKLKEEPGLEILVLIVDYDKEKDLRKNLKVRYQSTFIVYKGKTETTRILGDTDENKIRSGLKTAI